MLISRSSGPLEKLKNQSPNQVEVLAGDLADFSLGQKAVDIALSSFGRLDGLIVNHGILGEVARIADCDPMEVRKTFDINFFSAIACVGDGRHHLESALTSNRSKQRYPSFGKREAASFLPPQEVLSPETIAGEHMEVPKLR